MARLPLLNLFLASELLCLSHFGFGQRQVQVPLTGPLSQTPFTGEFSTFVHSVLDDFQVPGVSIAVVDGEETFSKGFGYATLPDVEATPETLWLGASTTKAFVAATLSHFIQNQSYPDLLEEGWATPISSIIPEDFVLVDDWATQHLTLTDAVSHRTGLPRHDLSWRYTKNGSHTPVRKVVRNLRHLPLVAQPRALFQYCNLMYMVLSHVVETLTKQPLKTTLKEVIWGPLDMKSTYLDLQEAKESPNHLATGYYWDNETQSHGRIQLDTLQESGAAGIITSVVDHAKWVRSLLYETAPLSNVTHADIRKPRSISTAEPKLGMDVTLYALGWFRTTLHGETLFHHSGESLSFGTTIFWLPERKYGVVVMGNVFLQANMAGQIIARKLVEDAMGIDPKKRFDIDKKCKETLEKSDREFAEAVETLYPKRPHKTLPPSVGLTQLAGEYHHAGYGSIILELTGEEGSFALVAERRDMVYQYRIHLEHVSGDDWVAYFVSAVKSRLPAQFFKATFKIDVKASALDITMDDQIPGAQPFTVTFDKVA